MPQHWHRGRQINDEAGPSGTQDVDPSPSQQQPPLPSSLERPKECINKHSTPAFHVLCSIMDRLRTEAAGKRHETLTRFMDAWRIKVGNDLYPLIRLLLPDRDRERPVYNLKEAMLAKCYIEVLGLDKHSETAQHLIKWKQPVDGQSNAISGDFARVCFNAIAARSTVESGQLTIDAVNSLLDDLARGRLKQSEIVPILRKINQQCTPVEQEWIIRIILKDLRISIREKGVFACFHPEAANLFNVCSDLKRVCWTLYKKDIHLEKNQTNIDLFRSFLPQLCYRSPSSSHEAIAKLVGAPTSEFIMEEKLDGERMQLHIRNGMAEWFYCSRKGKDYTYLYGAHPGEGSLTQFIHGVFQDGVRNIILDGEMLVWDPILEKYLAFGNLKTAAGDKTKDDNGPRPCFKIFDILYLNDVCLTSKRISERKRLLRSGKVFNDLEAYKGRLEFAEEQRGKSGKDIRAMLERILETKGEGLVVKRIDSTYQTNFRGADWVKVKPEYSDQMGETFDLLVLGGWWGKGGRTGKISSLLLGLRVPQDDDGSGETPVFSTFAKVGSGMSYEDYEWILNNHRDDWKAFDKNHPPAWLQLGAMANDDKPDVYIHPEKSFVIEAKASEIVPAIGNYGCGYTMRFPRCKFIYWDRASRGGDGQADASQDRDMWNCLSLDEFLALLNTPKRPYEDAEGGSSRKRRKVTTRKKGGLVLSVKGQKLDNEIVESGIFHGMTFSSNKKELEELVHKHGGDFTQQQLSDLSAYVIASGLKNALVKAQIRKGLSVVRPEWLYESIKRRRPLPLIKEFLLHASETDQQHRYFKKTLEEVDNLSLVRDRTGQAGSPIPEEELEEAEEDAYDDTSAGDEGVAEEQARNAQKSKKALGRTKSKEELDVEDEWGLTRSPVRSEGYDSDDGFVVRDGEAGDADEEEDYTPDSPADSHYSEPEDDEDEEEDRRMIHVHDPAEPAEDAMGASPKANTYDEDKIFNHLVFFIDTPENAQINRLSASSSSDETKQRLETAAKLLTENGGRITTDLLDPRLTHIIEDDDDSIRYREILKKTAEPRRRHIVLPSWVEECVEEDTLINEDAHKPR